MKRGVISSSPLRPFSAISLSLHCAGQMPGRTCTSCRWREDKSLRETVRRGPCARYSLEVCSRFLGCGVGYLKGCGDQRRQAGQGYLVTHAGKERQLGVERSGPGSARHQSRRESLCSLVRFGKGSQRPRATLQLLKHELASPPQAGRRISCSCHSSGFAADVSCPSHVAQQLGALLRAPIHNNEEGLRQISELVSSPTDHQGRGTSKGHSHDASSQWAEGMGGTSPLQPRSARHSSELAGWRCATLGGGWRAAARNSRR